jgi:hypothetical protein
VSTHRKAATANATARDILTAASIERCSTDPFLRALGCAPAHSSASVVRGLYAAAQTVSGSGIGLAADHRSPFVQEPLP